MYSCARLSLLFLGFLHVSLYQQDDSSLLGHVHVSEPKPVWNTLNICPTGLTNDKTTGEKLLLVVGKGNELSFTVQIAEGASEIALDQPHTANVQGDEVSVFQFISPQGISDKQLDITATSRTTVAAYLKVSQNCKEVALQKDLESIDNKKSLRLSFATKGRITLSSVSIPPLADSVSRWFIGIGLKNLSEDVKLSESKSVTLEPTRSFDYSYTTPVCVLLFVSFVVGILVSIVAYYLFEESLTQVKPGRGNNNRNLRISRSELLEVIRNHWVSFDPNTYSFITGIMGAVLMVGAFQFAFNNWDKMIQEGDRDNCYYNDFCYRVANHDIPFNLMISNLTYIVHGLILALWVLMLETKVNLRCKRGRTAQRAAKLKDRYYFSIAYAFSWALVYEGLFSALYHLCPNRFTFQIDTTFMFVLAGLNLLLLYYGIKQNSLSSSRRVKHLIGALNFFSKFIAPLFILNYYGVHFNYDGLNNLMQVLFIISLIIWLVVIFSWAFRELDILQRFRNGGREDKLKLFAFIFVLVFCLIRMFCLFSDLAQAFLSVCIICNIGAILVKLLEKLFKSIPVKRLYVKDIAKGFLIILTVIILVTAVYVFKGQPTTDKTSSPENSRDKNKECVILGFFDWHDLWHFLSSLFLLMGAFVIVFISS